MSSAPRQCVECWKDETALAWVYCVTMFVELSDNPIDEHQPCCHPVVSTEERLFHVSGRSYIHSHQSCLMFGAK